MKKFKDVKTGTQLLIGFGTLIILIIFLCLIAWQQTNRLAKQTENLYNHPLTVSIALGRFETAITAMHRDMKGLMLTKSEEADKRALILSQIEINKTEAFKQLDILESRYLGPAEDIKTLRSEFIYWNTIREETIRLLQKGDIETAVQRTTPDGAGGAQVQRLFAQTDKVDQFASGKAKSFHEQSSELKRDLNIQLLVFAILALILSVLIALYLSFLINQPLKELANSINSFRKGNMNARSRYYSKNQFGNVSASFNEMAETIETENLISNRAAELSGIMLSENDARSFCHDVLKNLILHTNSQMGAIYLLSDDQTQFTNFVSIGMDKEGCLPFSALNPEGEFGLALVARQIVHIKNISEKSSYFFNTVGGNFKPSEIITIPVFNGSEAVAVISLFSLGSYSDLSIRLLINIFNTLTARMNGILAYKQIVEFSQKLEEQNIELDRQKMELAAMAEELKEQNAELEVQTKQLSEVSQLKTNFLSSMSHELRTPLNSVIALSGVLNRRLAKKIDEEEYSYLGVIERNGKHLLNLINDILDLSRIESGKLDLEKNTFKINDLLKDVISMIKPQAEQKGISLDFHVNSNNPSIESDYTKCVHIFQNIIGNAVKFTEQGKVDVNVTLNNGNILVKISDTGIGISKEAQLYIFDEFRQADGSNSRRFGGTGLGLSIAKKYADLMGCVITVESETGKGSIFTVSIPEKATYKYQDSVDYRPSHVQKMPGASLKTGNCEKTILLVEDTEAMIVQIKDILEEDGYTIEIARSGIEALKFLENRLPDAIILDLMMPGMDGFELLNRMRSNNTTASLPVLVLTAKILSQVELNQIKNNHVHQLIQKGKITQESLLEAIAMLMINSEDIKQLKNVTINPTNVDGKPVLLAIEDNADNMLALKAMIGNRFIFFEATNGTDGIEKARKHNPHLILLDIAMPGLNGFETLNAIRGDASLKHIPIIAVTSSAMAGDKDYFLNYGFNGYVSKPVNDIALFDEIYKWIKTEKQ